MKTKLFFGADHAAFEFKNFLMAEVKKRDLPYEPEDCGTNGDASVDYPDFAKAVSEKVAKGEGLGVLCCGSGIGMSIAANKVKKVRAAVVWNEESARLAREHNNANVLCLGARLLSQETALQCLLSWLAAQFQGGRHEKRVGLIHKIEC